MSTVTILTPPHALLEQLTWDYMDRVTDFETPDPEQRERHRAFAAGYILSAAKRYYSAMMADAARREQPPELVAEIAFWKSLHHTYTFSARYAIAEKVKFTPPHI